jgi:hypothetical protein
LKNLLPILPNAKGYDFMSGMGHAWELIVSKLNSIGELIVLYLLEKMNRKGNEKAGKMNFSNISVIRENVLENNISDSSVDFF